MTKSDDVTLSDTAERRQRLSEKGAQTGAGVNGARAEVETEGRGGDALPQLENGPGVQLQSELPPDGGNSKPTMESQAISNPRQVARDCPPTVKQDANRTASAGRPLSPRQALFVDEYLVDGNATRAAARAGYSAQTAKQQGSRLLGVRHVKAAIREAMERRAERVELKQDDVLRELKVIAFAEPGEKYRASDKVKALDLLGKHLRMWSDKTDDGKVQVVIQREPAQPPAQSYSGAKA